MHVLFSLIVFAIPLVQCSILKNSLLTPYGIKRILGENSFNFYDYVLLDTPLEVTPGDKKTANDVIPYRHFAPQNLCGVIKNPDEINGMFFLNNFMTEFKPALNREFYNSELPLHEPIVKELTRRFYKTYEEYENSEEDSNPNDEIVSFFRAEFKNNMDIIHFLSLFLKHYFTIFQEERIDPLLSYMQNTRTRKLIYNKVAVDNVACGIFSDAGDLKTKVFSINMISCFGKMYLAKRIELPVDSHFWDLFKVQIAVRDSILDTDMYYLLKRTIPDNEELDFLVGLLNIRAKIFSLNQFFSFPFIRNVFEKFIYKDTKFLNEPLSREKNMALSIVAKSVELYSNPFKKINASKFSVIPCESLEKCLLHESFTVSITQSLDSSITFLGDSLVVAYRNNDNLLDKNHVNTFITFLTRLHEANVAYLDFRMSFLKNRFSPMLQIINRLEPSTQKLILKLKPYIFFKDMVSKLFSLEEFDTPIENFEIGHVFDTKTDVAILAFSYLLYTGVLKVDGKEDGTFNLRYSNHIFSSKLQTALKPMLSYYKEDRPTLHDILNLEEYRDTRDVLIDYGTYGKIETIDEHTILDIAFLGYLGNDCDNI